jgi:hypothetical protein
MLDLLAVACIRYFRDVARLDLSLVGLDACDARFDAMPLFPTLF